MTTIISTSGVRPVDISRPKSSQRAEWRQPAEALAGSADSAALPIREYAMARALVQDLDSRIPSNQELALAAHAPHPGITESLLAES